MLRETSDCEKGFSMKITTTTLVHKAALSPAWRWGGINEAVWQSLPASHGLAAAVLIIHVNRRMVRRVLQRACSTWFSGQIHFGNLANAE